MYSKLNSKEEIVIGKISNFDIVGSRDSLWLKPQIYIKTNTGNKYKVEVSEIEDCNIFLKLKKMILLKMKCTPNVRQKSNVWRCIFYE